jgi:mono/diheme cytochrome c family protein
MKWRHRGFLQWAMIGCCVWVLALAATANIAGQSAPASRPAEATPVTFHKDVEPLIQKHCVECHRPGQVAPTSWLTYESVRPYARAIKAMTAARQMPPWFVDKLPDVHYTNDRSLSQTEIDTFAKWADAGAPKGDVKDAPPPKELPADGWLIKPDIIVRGPAFKVPARPPGNVIEWTNIYVPSGFTKDTWVTSLEVKPSDLSVTHHICLVFVPHRDDVQYYTPTWAERPRDDEGYDRAPLDASGPRPGPPAPPRNAGNAPAQNLLTVNPGGTEICYLPGNSVEDYRPFGAGKLIPAGTDIRFQVHYTPSGKEAIDRPLVGFTVSDAPPKKRWLSTSVSGSAGSKEFVIPPNDANWAAPTGITEFAQDVELVMMQPHMHLRGKDMTYTLETPNGQRKVLLSGKYDFNWQFPYYIEPMKIAKGSKMYVDAHYNNGKSNKFNPSPDRPVYSGTMTWEEMMLPYVGIMIDPSVDPRTVFKRLTLTGPTEGGDDDRPRQQNR